MSSHPIMTPATRSPSPSDGESERGRVGKFFRQHIYAGIRLTKVRVTRFPGAYSHGNGPGSDTTPEHAKTEPEEQVSDGQEGPDLRVATTTDGRQPPTDMGVVPDSQVVQYFAGAHDFAVGTVVSGDFHVHYSQPSEVVRAGPTRREIVTIAKWLSSVNHWAYHDAAASRRAPNTGLWFIESTKFEEWVNSEECQSTLWALGMPGAGKSILSSTVVDHLRERFSKDPEVAVLFVYCRYTDHCTVGDVLRSCLKQLLETRYTAYHAIKPVYAKCAFRRTQLTDSEAETILYQSLLCFEDAYLVVDGLDEVSNDVRSKLLGLLRRLPTKVLLFSRPVDATTRSTSTTSSEIAVTAHDRDIEAFISDSITGNNRLRQLLSPDAASHIVREVKAKSHGMFLVAALQIEALKSCVNMATLMSTLESLPSGVNDIYHSTLCRIEAQGEAESDLAKRTLLWLAHAKRSLKISELQEALATSPETGLYDALALTPSKVILDVCCGLVVLNAASQEISLIHYTTHEFLLHLRALPFLDHAFVTTGTCMSTLALYGFMEQEFHDLRALAMFLSRAAFLPYAFAYWLEHASEVQEWHWYKRPALLEATKQLRTCSRLPCVACDGHRDFSLFSNRHLDAIAEGRSPRLDLHTPFQLAACGGVIPLLKVLPLDDKPAPLSGRTSLHLALKHGQEGLAQILIRTFPTLDVNAQDFSGRSSLHLAIRRSDLSTVNLLLNHPSLDVNARDKTEATPLWEAVCVAEEPILTSLLQHPAIDVNVVRGEGKPAPNQDDLAIELAETDKYARGMTPLILAVLSNKMATVGTLLRHTTIDPNLCDPDGVSPLIAALGPGIGSEWKAVNAPFPTSPSPRLDRSVNGSANMVELVLRHPLTNVNARHFEGVTPLMLASAAGRSDIVEVLLSHRDIDVNASGPQYATALSWVRRANRELSATTMDDDVGYLQKRYSPGILAAKCILSHPQLDPDLICDCDGRTPLMLASMLGFDSLVQTLLVQPRKSTSSWTTALSLSSLFSGVTSVFETTRPSNSVQRNDRDGYPSGLEPSRSGLLRALGGNFEPIGKVAIPRIHNSRVDRVNQIDSQGRPPIMLSLSPLNNNVQRTLEALLSHPNADANLQDVDGDTALILACRRNEMAAVRYLLSRHDIDINLYNARGTGALMAAAACRLGNPAGIVGLLLQDARVRHINKTDAEGRSALHLALYNATRPQGLAASVRLASFNLVDVNLRDGMGDTPLHIASYLGIPDVASVLLGRLELQVNSLDRRGSSPILVACEYGHWGIVRRLLQHKDIDVNVRNANGYAPLHIAAESGCSSAIVSLLQHPSLNVNCTNHYGYAAIHIAVRLAAKSPAVMQALLQHPRIDVNLRDSEGYAAVDVLVKLPNAAPLTTLLRHPRLESNPLDHRRSFYSACWRQIYSGGPPASRQAKVDRRMIRAFLLYDPDSIHLTDTAGKTVLHHAAKEGCHNMVELIVSGPWNLWDDVDLTSRDLEGKTALDYAVEGANYSIQRLLQWPPLRLSSVV